jgi:hypothetical protein
MAMRGGEAQAKARTAFACAARGFRGSVVWDLCSQQ